MMTQAFIFLALLSDKSRTSLLFIGIVTVVGGVMLMLRHKQEFDEILESSNDSRLRLYEQRKFRRRSLASSFVAAIGILMIALNWAIEPTVFVGLISVILILLLAAMFIAVLDLMSVSLHVVTEDDSARKQMIAEYLRQRQKLLDRVDDKE